MLNILKPGQEFPQEFPQGTVILVDKPLAWTSFDVVNKVRIALSRKLNKKKVKVGHAGTLDPLATGLLILCIGDYTKRIESFQEMSKTYTGTITLGATTDSYDLEKPVSATFPFAHIHDDLVQKTCQQFTGPIQQIPPVFSAIKIDGKRVYKHARTGETVEMEPRVVQIHRFTASPLRPASGRVKTATQVNDRGVPIMMHPDYEEGIQFDFEVECGKGTYIRSLAFDFGRTLDSGAYLSVLTRTKTGGFSLDDAWSMEELVPWIMG
jgi:tRNA pseudouridine55 synthase